MNPHDEQKLEGLVSHAVRGLPPRRAPLSLERRVQAEIARRAALPWWRRSFSSWPVAARAAFAVTSAAAVAVAFLAWGWLRTGIGVAQVKAAFAVELQWVRIVRALFETVSEAAQAVVGSISPVVLYGGAAVVIALYAALFGLGAAAYRTLYATR